MDNCLGCLMLKGVRRLKVEQIQFVDSENKPGYCRACYQRERADNETLRRDVCRLGKRLILSESQNYCKICGNTLDEHNPSKERK